jgi:hypothetical protein
MGCDMAVPYGVPVGKQKYVEAFPKLQFLGKQP